MILQAELPDAAHQRHDAQLLDLLRSAWAIIPPSTPCSASPARRAKERDFGPNVAADRSVPPMISGQNLLNHALSKLTLGCNQAVLQSCQRLRNAAGQGQGYRSVHKCPATSTCRELKVTLVSRQFGGVRFKRCFVVAEYGFVLDQSYPLFVP